MCYSSTPCSTATSQLLVERAAAVATSVSFSMSEKRSYDLHHVMEDARVEFWKRVSGSDTSAAEDPLQSAVDLTVLIHDVWVKVPGKLRWYTPAA